MSVSMIWIGMDVHKDTVMAAVYLGDAREAEVVQQLPCWGVPQPVPHLAGHKGNERD
jgi:hypothetical protein